MRISKADRVASWLAGVSRADEVGAMMRQALLLQASEFAEWAVIEGWRTGLTSDVAEQVLIGRGVSQAYGATGMSMRLVTPGGSAAFIEEINVHAEATTEGDTDVGALQLNIERGRYKPDGTAEGTPDGLRRLGSFPVGRYSRGSAGMLFGAIPVRQWLEPGEELRVALPISSIGTTVASLRVSAVVRFEPVELVTAAGMVRSHE